MLYLKEKREKIGKTLQQVAEEVGVTPDAMSKYEHGANLPGADKLPKLAAALGCTISELYEKEVG